MYIPSSLLQWETKLQISSFQCHQVFTHVYFKTLFLDLPSTKQSAIKVLGIINVFKNYSTSVVDTVNFPFWLMYADFPNAPRT